MKLRNTCKNCVFRNSEITLNNKKVDKCMMRLVDWINTLGKIKTLGCCCGHGKYPPTIIVKNKYGHRWEFISNQTMPRKRNFYRKDKQGFYYIPEVVDVII